MVLGVLSALVVSPITIWILHTLGVEGLRLWTFVASKASFAGALAAGVTPVVAAWALGDGVRASTARPDTGKRG